MLEFIPTMDTQEEPQCKECQNKNVLLPEMLYSAGSLVVLLSSLLQRSVEYSISQGAPRVLKCILPTYHLNRFFVGSFLTACIRRNTDEQIRVQTMSVL